jgi:hypothetical protein
MPAAAVLLRNFEHSAALLEQTLATYRHNDLIAARVKDAIYSSNATLPPTTPTEANEPSLAKLAYEAQMRDVGRLMEILREGGYHCELAGDTLH